VFEEHWRTGIRYDGALVSVHAMLVYAWAQHYGWRGPPLFAAALSPHLDGIFRDACMFSYAGGQSLPQRLGTRAEGIFDPGFLAAYRSGVWGPWADFGRWFRENRIGPYPQTAPLRIYQGDRDDIVPEAATRELAAALRAGGVNVDYQVVPGGTHGDVAFGFLSVLEHRTLDSIAWLRAELGR